MKKENVSVAQLMQLNSQLKKVLNGNKMIEDFRYHQSYNGVLPSCIDYSNGQSNTPNPQFSSREEYIEAVVNAELNFKKVSKAIAKVTSIIQASNHNTTVIYECVDRSLSELLLEKESLRNQFVFCEQSKKFTNWLSNKVNDERRDGNQCQLVYADDYKVSGSKLFELDKAMAEIDAILIDSNNTTFIEVDFDLLDTLNQLL